MGMYDHPPYYLSAYGLAVKHGFVGTEAQWLASLKGEKGDGLEISGSYATLAALETAHPTGADGFFRVGEEPNTKLYYWDEDSEDWLYIDLHGADGEDGASAYEQAVSGGYTGTEQQFNADLANFKTQAQTAQSASTAATAAKTAAETAATTATAQASAASGSATAAAGSATQADTAKTAAQQAQEAAQAAAAQAEGYVGNASWIQFDMEDDASSAKYGWLYTVESESFEGADFSVNNDNGAYQGWLEVSTG